MKKLGKRNYSILESAIKITGTYEARENFIYIAERLRCNEINEIESFLNWVHKNGKAFGSGNYEQIFSEYKTIVNHIHSGTRVPLTAYYKCDECDNIFDQQN